MKPVRRAQLLWHTVRHLRLAQVAGRLRLQTQAAWRRYLPDAARIRYERSAARLGLQPSGRRWSGALLRVAERAASEEVAASVSRADDALAGRFRFLNATHTFGRPIAWNAAEASQLWRYKLHYGAYLVDLAATRPDGWPAVASLMREWIDANPIGRASDAWHPFVVSERVVNWILAIHLSAPASRDIGDDILKSLAVQSVFVGANLETDVGGNHLLKNLKAMVVAAYFWEGRQAELWRAQYLDAFDDELSRQVLADGAHYERSPMYHALVLTDALEVLCVLRACDVSAPSSLTDVVKAMADYLPHITHPDGEIALFNDSVFGEASRPAALRALASHVLDDDRAAAPLSVRHAALTATASASITIERRPARARGAEDGGLVAVPALGDRGFLLMDAGRACPDELPAHAHADLFSFELTIDGARFIVDSGVGEYQAGPWRDYYRSTRAHNTVAIDGVDQIECWGSFRVARRARILDRRAIRGPLVQGVTARHDGYARLPVPVDVRRTFVELAGRAWLIIDDLEGTGEHLWESFLHAAPDVRIEIEGPAHARLTRDQQQVSVAWFGVATASVVTGAREPRQGWYAPEFGRHLPAPVLVLAGRGQIPAECGYLIVPDVPPSEVVLHKTTEGLDIVLGSDRYFVRSGHGTISVESFAVA